MKKIFLIILSCIFLIFLAWFQFGIFTDYNFFTAKNDIENKKVFILTIGEPDLNPEKVSKISQKFGFQYRNLGCNSTMQLQNSTNLYNDVVFSYLDRKNGKNWKQKFDQEISNIIGN